MAYAAQQQRAKLGGSTGPNPAMPLPAPAPSLPGNAGAKTMIADPSAAVQRPVAPQAPEMVAPAQPKMNTMRIATPPADAAPAGPEMATIVIDSTPQGAEVIGPDEKSLGTTPAKLSLPISDLPQDIEQRLAGKRTKTKQIVVTGNTVVTVLLDRVPASNGGSHGPGRRKDAGVKHNPGNELMNPDDL
jgi:hypothetical protein